MAMPPVVGLEIGTSKVIALVGEQRDDGHVMITGMGERESAGVRKGEISDMAQAQACVHAALEMAEESADLHIREVSLAVSGGHIQSQINRGATPVMDRAGGISQEDIDQVMEVASAINLPHDREVLHTICQHFMIDEETRVVNPEGMDGARLAVNMLALHGVRSRIQNSVRILESLSYDVGEVVFDGVCAAMSVLTPEQRKSGVIVIDLGGGTTDYLAYAEGVVAAGGALGIGGDHVTNDIALAFNIATSRAERLKQEHGRAMIDPAQASRRISLPAEVGFPSRAISLQALQTVVHARCEETFSMIKARLDRTRMLTRIGAGVVLTGGGSRLAGIDRLAERVFGLPCCQARPRNLSGVAVATEGPEYAVCCGLVKYAFKCQRDQQTSEPISEIMSRVRNFFKSR